MRKELTFMEAVEEYKKDIYADNGDKLIINGNILRIEEVNQIGIQIPIRPFDTRRKWYIEEPDETLSDKIQRKIADDNNFADYLEVDDIKEALERYITWSILNGCYSFDANNEAAKIFGKELLK